MTQHSLFVDTGAWFAFTNSKDPDHRKVREALENFDGHLVTSSYVLDETVTLTLARLGHRIAVQVGSVLLDPAIVEVVHISAADEASAWVLFRKRPDKRYSFTDCTSFVL